MCNECLLTVNNNNNCDDVKTKQQKKKQIRIQNLGQTTTFAFNGITATSFLSELWHFHTSEDNTEMNERTEMERAERLSPECDGSGNVEYKLKLVNPSASRVEHLTTQMKWRLAEGGGEAIYELGVDDSGVPTGMTAAELKETLATLRTMAGKLGASLTVLRERIGLAGTVAEVLVRTHDGGVAIETRVAALGNVDSGKSTLLGVLSHGGRDNGRGSARMLLFRHKHEMETGRTSSVAQEMLCFDSRGKILSYREDDSDDEDSVSLQKLKGFDGDGDDDDEELVDAFGSGGRQQCDDDDDELESLLVDGPAGGAAGGAGVAGAAKIVSFVDLAGHEKYLRTTLFGLTSHQPDYAMLVVGANMGVVGMAKEHLGLALALRVPVFVVLTKTDMCPAPVLKDTLAQLKRLLKGPGCRMVPLVVRTMDDVVVCARNMVGERIAPIFCVSSVTGTHLGLLRRFLNLLPTPKNWDALAEEPLLYSVDAKYSVPGIGTVLSGTVLQGSVGASDTVLLGPDTRGHFCTVALKGLRTNDVDARRARAGQSATLALRGVPAAAVRTGMVVLARGAQPVVCCEFQAEVRVLYHRTTIAVGYEAVVHCGNVTQTARVVAMDAAALRTGDKALVTFRFLFSPEYILPGQRIIVREGRARCIGRITAVTPYTTSTTAAAAAAAAAASAAPNVSASTGTGGRRRKARGPRRKHQQQSPEVVAAEQQQQQPARGRGRGSYPRETRRGTVVTPPPARAPADPETGRRGLSILRRSSGDVPTAPLLELGGVAYTPLGPSPEHVAASYRAALEKSM